MTQKSKNDPEATNPTNQQLPLTGMRVVELADGLGEMCGRMLGDFGAEVIKVEPPQGAESRKMSPIAQEQDISCYFTYRNFNKKGIVLDLENLDDLASLKKLLASTDILVESYKPGRLKQLGLDPEELQKEFPHLIITSITPFGQTGPYSQYEATDETIFALSGWLALSGIAEKPPITAPGYMAYDIAGLMGCFASLLAVIKRYRTGMGQHLDVSALESLAQCGTWGLSNVSATMNAGNPVVRMRTGSSPLYEVHPTTDGRVRLVVLSPRQWKSIWEWMGEPEEFSDPIWEQAFERIINADVLNPYFEKLFAPQKMAECAKEAQRRGVVVTPMLKPDDILNNEHFISRETFLETEVAPKTVGKITNGWMELNSNRIGFHFRAPTLGEHTQDILNDATPPIQLEQNPDDDSALAGYRVMDFGHGGVGVEGSKLLAEYGADVIKIETRTYPDFMRTVLGTEMSPSFASSSRSKRSLGANAKNPEGNKILHQLAKVSDVVIENNSTGTMEAMGVSYTDLAKSNPEITLVSSQMMGSHGVYGDWIGYGPTIATVGGIDWLWNFNDGDPPPGTAHIHPDHMAGRACAIAGLLGIISKTRYGAGFHAEMAQVENLMCTLGDFFLAESLNSGSVIPQGNNSGGDYSLKDAVWGPYLCAVETTPDGEQDWCVICVRTDQEWAALVELMDNPEWAQNPSLVDRKGRLENQELIGEGVSNWTKDFSSYEVMQKCQEANVPAGAMIFYDQFITDPHLVDRGFPLKHTQQGLAGDIYFEGPGFKASNLPEAYFCEAPMLGQHTYEICNDLFGLSEEEIAKLIENGAIEAPSSEADEVATKTF